MKLVISFLLFILTSFAWSDSNDVQNEERSFVKSRQNRAVQNQSENATAVDQWRMRRNDEIQREEEDTSQNMRLEKDEDKTIKE